MRIPLVYQLPAWLAGALLVVVFLAALEAGYRIGLRRRHLWKDADAGGGHIVLTSMFALLGLILAFTYAFTVSRHEARKQAVIAEANALGTAFLRAGPGYGGGSRKMSSPTTSTRKKSCRWQGTRAGRWRT